MRVVLVRLSALGDIVHTWPLAAALRQARARLHLTWVVEEPLRTLVEGHPAVDAVLTVNTRRWRRAPFGALTRAEMAAFKARCLELEPDLCLDPQGVLKSALVTWLSTAERRIGLARPWRREWLPRLAYTATLNGNPSDDHVVATNLEMVRALGQEPPESSVQPDGGWLLASCHDAPLRQTWRAAFGVLLPGAGHAFKTLGVDELAEIGRVIAAHGLEVVVAWGPGEEGRAAQVVETLGPGAHLAPPTDLRQLARLLGEASIVVGGDTGPVHLAASFGTPTVAVFITTSPGRNGPRGRRAVVVPEASATAQRPTGSARTGRRWPVSMEEIAAAVRTVLHDEGLRRA
jgi:heptosyltransferase-1